MKPAHGASTEESLTLLINEIEKSISPIDAERSETFVIPPCDNEKSSIELGCEIDSNLRLLKINAILGDGDAIRALRDVGIAASDILTELSLAPKDRQNQIAKFPPQFPDHTVTVLIKEQIPQILLLINKSESFIRSLSLQQIEDAFTGRIDEDFGLHFEFTELEYYTPLSNRPRDASLSANKESSDSDSKGFKSEKANDVSLSRFVNLVHKFVGSFFVKDFRSQIISRVQSLATNSLEWPITGSAWEESWKPMDITMRDLELGTELPFRVRRNSTRGRNRDLGEDSGTLFLLSICGRLLGIQAEYSNIDEATRSKLATADIQLDRKRKANKNNPEAAIGNESDENKENSEDKTQDELIKWNHHSHWELKAILLPTFPDSTVESSEPERLWKEAIAFFAEDLCRGDWENYPWWPAGIKQRAGYDKKSTRNRSTREAFGDLINSGFSNLLK